MKYIVIWLIVFIITACILGRFFPESTERVQQRINNTMSEVNYKGHSYIIYNNGRTAGITHNPNCECFKREEQKKEVIKYESSTLLWNTNDFDSIFQAVTNYVGVPVEVLL